jgi:hypothetical protein
MTGNGSAALRRRHFHHKTSIEADTSNLAQNFQTKTFSAAFAKPFVSGWAAFSCISNISVLVELADILHFHNCKKRNNHLV